jgi:hypothetical protein
MGHEKKVKPSLLTFPSGIYASGFWRILFPTFYLEQLERIDLITSSVYLKDPHMYEGLDVLWIQRATSFEHLKYIESIALLREKYRFVLIHDIDDVLIREDMPTYYGIESKPHLYNGEALKKIFSLCDEITVSTPFLKQYYLNTFGPNKITVVPNRIPFSWAGNFYNEEIRGKIYKKHLHRPRILFAGSTSHMNAFGALGNDDFTHIIEAIKTTLFEFKWIFLGAIPFELKENLLNKDVEYYEIETMDGYHKKLASLEVCMMIAPLADNINNHGKSNCKFLEASAHGIPIACQDITPYKMAPIRFSSGDQMVYQIRKTLSTEEGYTEACRRGRKMVETLWLELDQNIALYTELFSTPYQDERRTILKGLNE